LLAGRTTLIKL